MKLLTIKEAQAFLPIAMSERAFRQLVRKSGCYMEHRRQLMLTESDLQHVLETLRPCSSSSSATIRPTGKSGARSNSLQVMIALAVQLKIAATAPAALALVRSMQPRPVTDVSTAIPPL